MEHIAYALAGDLAGYRRDLDAGSLKHLLKSVVLARAFLDKLTAIAYEFPKLSVRPLRHEAASEEAMPQEVRQPLGILDIGLTARHGLELVRMTSSSSKS